MKKGYLLLFQSLKKLSLCWQLSFTRSQITNKQTYKQTNKQTNKFQKKICVDYQYCTIFKNTQHKYNNHNLFKDFHRYFYPTFCGGFKKPQKLEEASVFDCLNQCQLKHIVEIETKLKNDFSSNICIENCVVPIYKYNTLNQYLIKRPSLVKGHVA
jgi:hypothetical protein